MAEDPKRLMVEVIGRLGRETQIHIDERHHHFRITNLFLYAVAAFLMIVAIFNVYYISILWEDLNGIVNSMDSMHTNLQGVSKSMHSVTAKVELIDKHMAHMDEIYSHTESMGELMPSVRESMGAMADEMVLIERDMSHLDGGMSNIELRFIQITDGVGVMRSNVRQISRPMGILNPIMP
ncbi:translation initiation factor 2 [endosymbiont of Lamellibrachia barhami]|uniref:translation initiation factor 2 n=1 Tax=endosymbiont of Lamellibrachia barhami TaxID=205975 RepID=UPI0015AB4A55|nr:translation initiation factor 2 [endosymbiont of Lamellibrachia barhami]